MKVWESAVRRAQSLVSPTAVSPSSSESSSGEILLSNGDFYTGQWSPDSGVAQGSGKYLWSDGCMYEGQWSSDGLPDGQGKFSWPSGATYEGHFRSSYMDGFGTYTATSGATYRGFWSVNRKHGDGTKSFPNGDFYDGQWLRDLPDGRGRYVWANGDEYYGQWRTGVIHGAGSFVCTGGERYDGEWDSGRPADERFAVAVGVLRVLDPDAASVLPSQKPFDWPKGGSFDGDAEIDQGCCVGDRTPTRFRSCACGNKRRRKKQGETISKGHKNYELMLNLQLGIRHAVGKQPSQPITLDLKVSAFDPKEKVWTKFPPEGTKHTPPHQSCDFKWKDYCPLVFRTLRNLFKVDAADYMLSICGDDALRELSSPGKSGSFFYLTNDDRYMIKTMKKSEAKVLIRMLPTYYNHVQCFKNTLVTRFFGLHCVKLTGPTQKKVRFVIMGNLFCSEYSIHRRFDLKGSSLGRITDKPESKIDETTTLKDLDLNFLFRLQSSWFEEFQWQVERDCEFLEQERIMDYSLLVGVHFRDGHRNVEPSDPNRAPVVRLGVNLASRVERTVSRIGREGQLIGEPTGEICNVILFFGIIDILQDYDISKKLEHAYKSFQHDPTSISAVDPIQYAKRFKDFVCKVFIEDT